MRFEKNTRDCPSYPVRGVAIEFPYYIIDNKENKKLRLKDVVEILNNNQQPNKYEVEYDGDLNFIIKNDKKIKYIEEILLDLNNL